jgi:polyisoprenyl-phosphate glycosyltransferase
MTNATHTTDSIDIIVPIYNEESCLSELLGRLMNLGASMAGVKLTFIFVNDGSTDGSERLLFDYAEKYDNIKVLSFSRNFGQQIAITAGLEHADADYIAILDADLQDPPELIEQMYLKAKEGNEIVYGQRINRQGEMWFKKVTAALFYKLLSILCDIAIPRDTGDFRLFSAKVHTSLVLMREKHRFIRGMIPWLGFKAVPLLYNRDSRFAGKSKYPLKRMIRFAKDAIFSFSDVPIRIVNMIGLCVVCFSIMLAMLLIYFKLFTTFYVPGITTVIVTITLLGGIQIIILGIIGEYIGRIFEESKGRPLYIISETRNLQPDSCQKEKDTSAIPGAVYTLNTKDPPRESIRNKEYHDVRK